MKEYNFNTSAMIRDSIPNSSLTGTDKDIHVLKYPIDVECTFESMGNMIDEVWSRKLAVFHPGAQDNQTIDYNLVIHMGMREGEDRICFESMARKERMKFKGLDGKGLPSKYDAVGGLWEGVPGVLHPDLDIAGAAEKVALQYPVSINRSMEYRSY